MEFKGHNLCKSDDYIVLYNIKSINVINKPNPKYTKQFKQFLKDFQCNDLIMKICLVFDALIGHLLNFTI